MASSLLRLAAVTTNRRTLRSTGLLARSSLQPLSYPPEIKFQNIRTMSTDPAKYLCVHVFCKIKPGTEQAFKEASLQNARNSALEPGIARFDVLQDQADPCSFVLVEVYKDAQAPAAHKSTLHYEAWRETVADMMAEPRKALKFDNLFPSTAAGWEYGDTDTLE